MIHLIVVIAAALVVAVIAFRCGISWERASQVDADQLPSWQGELKEMIVRDPRPVLTPAQDWDLMAARLLPSAALMERLSA